MIFAVFLDRGEVVLDGVEVWGIRWQTQQRGACVLDQVHRFWRCVKGRVVHDNQVLASQPWAQPRVQPEVKHLGIARAFEEGKGSSSSGPIRAAISEVRGRRCPDIKPYTRWPLGAYP